MSEMGTAASGPNAKTARFVSALASFDLTSRFAIVTGAGSGLGRHFALALADVGAYVVCADINAAGAAETADLVAQNAGEARALTVDVNDPDSVARMVDAAGPVRHVSSILVNCAGIASASCRVHEMSLDDWDRVVGVNLRGTFLCTRALLPQMMQTGSGVIINLASVGGVVAVRPGVAVNASYVASKAGVIGFTKQIAVEYARDGIRANVIAPGWHPGGGLGREITVDDAERARHFESICEAVPMGRVGQQEELRMLLLYLASDASSYVTGQVITQDGGWTAY